MHKTFEALLPRMQELKDLGGVVGLLTWDQETYLPKKAEDARASQLSTLQGLYHERLSDPALGELVENTVAESDDERAMVRVFKLERDRAIKVPTRLVKALAESQSHGLTAWRKARDANDFKQFAPALGTLLSLRREQADALGHDGERYDALLENFEPGMRVKRLTPVLSSLRDKLLPLVEELTSRPPPEDVLRNRAFDEEAQWRFTLLLLRQMGFDLDAGRQDKSIHPFTGGTHPTDVRLTTRIDEQSPFPALFGAIHEGGHGLYEQGFSPAHYRTPLAAAPSMGLHESQSRLWENIVGRGRPFWSHFFTLLQKELRSLEDVPLDAWLREVNRVERSLIRTESDEVTYNLHIVVRYELELELLRDSLPLSELSNAWNERMEKLLGVRPTNDKEGVLQDIHWAWGELGYFPTYALGNLYSASLWSAAKSSLPELETAIGRGELTVLRDWLRRHVHQEGYRLPAEALVQRVTGHGLTDADFLAYLRSKYAIQC